MTLGSIDKSYYDNPDLDIFNKFKIKYIIHHLSPHQVVPSLWFKFKFNIRLLQKRIRNNKKNQF